MSKGVGAEGGQRTSKVTEDGGEASTQITGLRGIPSQRTCFKQKDDVSRLFCSKIHQRFTVLCDLLDAR